MSMRGSGQDVVSKSLKSDTCANARGCSGREGWQLVTRVLASVNWFIEDRLQNSASPDTMKNFPHASFPPETIALMTTAMDAALSRLPHPANSAHIQSIAETILRSAQEGERDPVALERMALLELIISPRD